MTQWVENPEGGRDRGPAALGRAWVEVILRPRQFYEVGVAPGDQAPGLVFAMAVVFVEELTRLLLSPGANPLAGSIGGDGLAMSVLLGILWIGVAVLLITPAVLHLLAAVATLLLIPLAEDRAGVSETVQVLAYSTAPCALAGLQGPELTAICGIYGVYLLIVGVKEVHRISTLRSVVVAAIPVAVAFGYGFRAIWAVGSILARWYII